MRKASEPEKELHYERVAEKPTDNLVQPED